MGFQLAQQFGTETLQLLDNLMHAIYAAREQPPDQALTETYQQALADYRERCDAVAREMLNDWDAIFQVLAYPHLPLTNNEGHWVILRNVCHGMRTEEGSKILAILISVIETCRVRQQSPWIYLAMVIRQRRAPPYNPKASYGWI